MQLSFRPGAVPRVEWQRYSADQMGLDPSSAPIEVVQPLSTLTSTRTALSTSKRSMGTQRRTNRELHKFARLSATCCAVHSASLRQV